MIDDSHLKMHISRDIFEKLIFGDLEPPLKKILGSRSEIFSIIIVILGIVPLQFPVINPFLPKMFLFF